MKFNSDTSALDVISNGKRHKATVFGRRKSRDVMALARKFTHSVQHRSRLSHLVPLTLKRIALSPFLRLIDDWQQNFNPGN